ncbi:phosphate regulon sensor histidine kinase PhoR [Gellertiella hungarica]|nr:phosphate regulon sensor histidine kinase PhoR [Gellertiella hungarica]
MLAALLLAAAAALAADLPAVPVVGVWLLLSLVALMRSPAPLAPPLPAVRPDPVAVPAGRDASQMIEALDFPVLLISQEEEILLQNQAALEVFGSLPDRAHISARLRAPGLLDMVREGLKTGHPQQKDYVERVPSARAYRVRVSPVGDGQFLIVFNDVSGLHRIDQMRTDFVANASHELRTPLASLRGFIETLQGPARADPKAQERFLGIMLDQVNRMSRLVDDLLSLSRLELKSHIAPGERVDLVPVLSHVRDSLMPLGESLGVTISLSVPDGPVIVPGDRDELVQVFENLVENACKYGQEGKSVAVELSSLAGGGAEVSVTDHGPGIEAEHVPRLTERFYRVNVEASRSKKGTGLGLAIVKHILTRHRARLLIQSEPGKGSRFTVRF